MEKRTYLVMSAAALPVNWITIPFQTQSSTRQDSVLEIPADRAQRILLEHAPERAKLLLSFGVVDLVHELDSLSDGEVGPVDALGSVEIIRMEEIIQNLHLPALVVGVWETCVVVTCLGTVRGADHAHVGGIMMLVVVELVGHCQVIALSRADSTQWDEGEGKGGETRRISSQLRLGVRGERTAERRRREREVWGAMMI